MGSLVSAGSSLLSGGGSVVSSILGGETANDAAKQQSNAISNIQAYTNANMDPTLVNQQALDADTARIKNQLALQAQVDPTLAAQRGASETGISTALANINNPASAANQVSQAATTNALTQGGALTSSANSLVNAANAQLAAGATLPPDVQAQLVQAGLSTSAGVTGGAPGSGAGSTGGGAASSILSQVLGTAGINLQMQRQQQAQSLLQSASGLQSQQQQVLQGLFPKLQQQQMGNLSANTGVLQNENSLLPQAGLTGTQVASDWLARVGAINQLSTQKSQVQAQGALATGAANANMWGTIASAGQGGTQTTSPLLSGLASFFNTPSTPSSSEGATTVTAPGVTGVFGTGGGDLG